jgi:hypothetical protein
MSTKTFETQFSAALTRCIYAVFDDIEADWDGTSEFNPLSYQSYKNLCKTDKNDKADGVKARFTLLSEARQFMVVMFNKMIEEINVATNAGDPLTDDDSSATIAEKLGNANAECYTQFMFDLASRYRSKFGPVLAADADPTKWIRGQIVGSLPKYSAKEMVIARLNTEFTNFLKALAWIIGKLIWYTKTSVSESLFLGLLAQQSMPQEMLDILQASLRAKPEKAPSKKTKKPAEKPAGSEKPEPNVEATIVSSVQSTVATTGETVNETVQSATQPAALTALDDVLAIL